MVEATLFLASTSSSTSRVSASLRGAEQPLVQNKHLLFPELFCNHGRFRWPEPQRYPPAGGYGIKAAAGNSIVVHSLLSFLFLGYRSSR